MAGKLNVVIRKDKEGYTANCGELKGCEVEAKTEKEVIDKIMAKIELQLSQAEKSNKQRNLYQEAVIDISFS